MWAALNIAPKMNFIEIVCLHLLYCRFFRRAGFGSYRGSRDASPEISRFCGT
jgi:hypothetical protein